RIDDDLHAGVGDDLQPVEADLAGDDRGAAGGVAGVAQEAARLGDRVDVPKVHVGARDGGQWVAAEAAEAVAVEVAQPLDVRGREGPEGGHVDLGVAHPAGLWLLEGGKAT